MPLSKRASLQAQRMMREAFMELERVITVSDRAQLKNLSLEDVQQAALQIEKQLAASQSLRNMRRLAPLFTGLGHYSQAIEVLCSGTPYLPWLWAPIKLVLKISADYIEAFEQIIKVYCRLAEPLARFNLFDRAYSNNIEVQNTLAVYYSDILKFHGEAYKFVRRNAWQRLFATSWGRFQRRFDNIFADLKAHEDLVDKTANAANLSEAKEMREKLEDWRQQEMAKLKKEEEERTSTEFQAVLSVLKVDEIHQIKVFDNLISEADRNLGSCSWILQQQKIRSWARCERDTQFVVLHGVVGSGKSVLAAQIATFLRALEGSLVAAHFCTYLYPESTDYNYIMRSLMIQIIRLDPELITLSYDWLILKKKAPSNTVVEQLLRLLVEAMGALAEKKKTLHIIIDGLDECDDNTVASVVKTLDKLVTSASSSASTLLKVLLCTQMRPEVIKLVKRKHQVSLSCEKDHLNKAIQDYTLQRINDIRPSLSQLGITDGDVTALASQITQKADGMFLWAKLVMEYINKNLFYHRDEILKAAVSLPRELGEFYGRMLSQIMANFDERSSQRISAVLSWIAFAKRPLRLAELLSALAFDTKQEQVDGLVPAYILDRCEPLIQKQADSSYSFVHVSVRDFLQSSDTALLITEDESQRRHGLATIRCLLSGQQIFAPLYPDSERTLRVLCGLHGFHMYATEYWVDYLLASLEFDQAQFFDSDFFALSCRLAENFIAAETDCEAAYGSLSDTRLALIRQKDYRLYKMVKVVLLEQNKETIEVVSIHDNTTCIQDGDTASDVITLKKKYQTVIQKLLNYSNYPGISFQQLEQFKQNFRTSAFTCRVWSCTYATLGFSNIDSLTRHEANHSKHICRVQGCQYPVFASARSLKNHVAEHHTNRDRQLPRNSIRKRPALVDLPATAQNSQKGRQRGDYNQRIMEREPQRIDWATRQAEVSEEAEDYLFTSGSNSFEGPNLAQVAHSRQQPSRSIAGVDSSLLPGSIAPDVQSQMFPLPDPSLGLNFGADNVPFPIPNMNPIQVVPSQMHLANDAIPDTSSSNNWDGFPSAISRTSSPAPIDDPGETASFGPKSTPQTSLVTATSGHRPNVAKDGSKLDMEEIVVSGDQNPQYSQPPPGSSPGAAPGSRSRPQKKYSYIDGEWVQITADGVPIPRKKLRRKPVSIVKTKAPADGSKMPRLPRPRKFRDVKASPMQNSPLAPLPPHDLASQPLMPSQERNATDFITGTPQLQQKTTGMQAAEQQRHQTSYSPLRPPGPLSVLQQRVVPFSTPPHLLGSVQPPPPAPPLKAADLQSKLTDYTSANKTPHHYRQAPYIGSSATELPYGPAQASSSPPTLPPVWHKHPILRICSNTNPCPTCVSSKRLFCSKTY